MRPLSPDIYTKEYYLEDCSDFKEFRKTFGKSLGSRLKYVLSFFKIKKGMKVLDIGCGRGEVAFWAARNGAEVVGIDYSKAGIKLAKSALKKQPKHIRKKVKFYLQNAKQIDFSPESFDAAFLIDVLEHLYPKEQDLVLRKSYKVLKDGGTILAHTEPNRIYIDYTYPFWCYPVSSALIGLWSLLIGKKIPNLPLPLSLRTESHKIMHINEPTYTKLRNTFNSAGFQAKIITRVLPLRSVLCWKDWLYNFLVFLDPISRFFPLNAFYANDFIIVAVKGNKVTKGL